MQPLLVWSIRERAGITKAQKLVGARTTSEGLCGGSRRSGTLTGDSIGSRGTLRRTALVFLSPALAFANALALHQKYLEASLGAGRHSFLRYRIELGSGV